MGNSMETLKFTCYQTFVVLEWWREINDTTLMDFFM